MGTSDIYRAVESLPEIAEALVVGVERPDGSYWMPLFVTLATTSALDDEMRAHIRTTIRKQVSPRHVPDDIIAAPGIPHTLTGKKIEIPIKRLLQGHNGTVQKGAIDNPDLLDWYRTYAPTPATHADTVQAEADKGVRP
jgi:acetoacetyl-CoA synthetase